MLAIGSCLWETVDMAKERTPKKGDRVFAKGCSDIFAVIDVHSNPNTVDVQLLKGIKAVTKDIPWTALIFADKEDASPAVARIVNAEKELAARQPFAKTRSS